LSGIRKTIAQKLAGYEGKGTFGCVYEVLKRIDIRLQCRSVNRGMVSVVIPIYDRTTLLRESIESILAQTYQNFELLLVCDGSPQETLDVVNAYRNHPKVRIFQYEDNSGNAVRGRNRALAEARGEYFAFQDSDDIAEPDRLRNSVLTLKLRRADVVYGTWRALVEGRENAEVRNGQKVKSPDCSLELLKRVCVPCQSTVLGKTKAFRDAGGLKACMRYREDHELWLRMVHNGYRFRTCRRVLTNLRLHADNLELSLKGDDAHWKELMLNEYTRKPAFPLQIGFVIPGCTISGGMSVIFTYANALKRSGAQVYMLCTGEITSTDWFENQQIEVLPIEKAPVGLNVLISTAWNTDWYLNHMKADRKVYLLQADERKFYLPDTALYRMAERTYCGSKREIVVIAGWMKRWLKEEFGLESTVIRNGIRYRERFANAVPVEPRGEKLRILIEGDPKSELKNVAAAFQIARQIEDAEIWYVNPVDEENLGAHRVFTSVPTAEIPAIFASCHVLIKTSRSESYCLPAIEMMATGGVVIAFETDGVKEFMRHGENGYIVAQDDVQEAVRILRELQSDRQKLASVAERAKADASEYELEKQEEQFVSLILGQNTL